MPFTLTPEAIMQIADKHLAMRDALPTLRGQENIVAFADEIASIAVADAMLYGRNDVEVIVLPFDEQCDDMAGVPQLTT